MMFVHSTRDLRIAITPSNACLRILCSAPKAAYLALILLSPTAEMLAKFAVCAAMKVAILESVDPSSAFDCRGK